MAGYIGRTFMGAQSFCVAIIFSWLTGCGSGGSSSNGVDNNSSASSSPLSSLSSQSSLSSSSSLLSSSSSSSSNSSSSPSSTSSYSSSSSISLPSTFSVSGTLQGNTGSVTLSLNGQQQIFSGNSFTFTQKINQSENYNVAFVSESTNKGCTVTNGDGTAQNNIINILVNCVTPPSTPLSVLRFDRAYVYGGLATGDFNGDGFADLALPAMVSLESPIGVRQAIKFLLGDGAGNFPTSNDADADFFSVSAISQRGRQSVVADFNNDGFDDYVLHNRMYFHNATGVYSTVSVESALPSEPLVAADINGDGLPDLIRNLALAGSSISGNYFMRQINNGVGGFSSAQLFASHSEMDITWSAGVANYTLADTNGDGISDIIVLGSGTMIDGGSKRVLQILRGKGDGTYTPPTSAINLPDDIEQLSPSVSWIYSKEIATGDFDGDGDIDLAITSDTSFVQIMVNDGNGNFTQGQRVIVGTRPIHVRVADFNLDGKLDLVTANATSKTIHISYGVGDSTFGDSTGAQNSWVSVELPQDAVLVDMVVADFDGDGVPDIAVAETGTTSPGTEGGSVQIVFAAGL